MGADNAWWLDVLENGPASRYADYFDIDWAAGRSEPRGQGAAAGAGRSLRRRCSSAASCKLAFEPDAARFARALLRAPLPDRSARVSAHPRAPRCERCAARCARGRRARDCASSWRRFAHLPPRDAAGCRRAHAQRNRDKEVPRPPGRARAARTRPSPTRSRRVVTAINGSAGEPRASTRCTRCSKRRPTGWRTGAWPPTRSTTAASSTSTTSRRCAWRTRRVFDATHALRAASSPRRGKVDGLRIDHPDGLYDPAQYFARLQERYRATSAGRRRARERVHACRLYWCREDRRRPRARARGLAGARHHRLSLRQRGERPVRGRRGRAAARPHLARVHRRRRRRLRRARVRRAKRAILRGALASELTVLATELRASRSADRRTRDFTLNTLREALDRGGRLLSRSTAPTSTTTRVGAGPALHRVGGRARAPAQPRAPTSASSISCARCCSASRRRALRPTAARGTRAFAMQVPAVHRAGDGQGRRGHGVLPLQPPGRR